jgi:adenylate kinase family enzyme
MEKLNRIAIIGAPGSGKTTLSQRLEKVYNLPLFNIDTIYQLPNWVMRDPKERDAMILEEADKDQWIIDGTFIDTLEYRVNRADKVIFLDYSTWTFLRGIFDRLIHNYGKEKPDMPGCKERFDLDFIFYVATYNIRRRKYVLEVLDKFKDKDIMIFRKQKDLNKWVEELEASK